MKQSLELDGEVLPRMVLPVLGVMPAPDLPCVSELLGLERGRRAPEAGSCDEETRQGHSLPVAQILAAVPVLHKAG